jgi:hypothetical protein
MEEPGVNTICRTGHAYLRREDAQAESKTVIPMNRRESVRHVLEPRVGVKGVGRTRSGDFGTVQGIERVTSEKVLIRQSGEAMLMGVDFKLLIDRAFASVNSARLYRQRPRSAGGAERV